MSGSSRAAQALALMLLMRLDSSASEDDLSFIFIYQSFMRSVRLHQGQSDGLAVELPLTLPDSLCSHTLKSVSSSLCSHAGTPYPHIHILIFYRFSCKCHLLVEARLHLNTGLCLIFVSLRSATEVWFVKHPQRENLWIVCNHLILF